jgi:hypothetical protein
LIEPTFTVVYPHVVRWLSLPDEAPFDIAGDGRVAEATAWWGDFREGTAAPPAEPYKAPPKVGRNEPCPCESGRKYKKCCGA